MGEPAKSKGKRYVVMGIVIIFLGIGLTPVMTGMGAILSHANANVLSSQDNAIYVYGATGSAIPFSSVNGSVEYTMPVNQSTSYVEFNATVQDLINHAVNKIILTTGYAGNANVTMGFGTNVSNFEGYEIVDAVNGTSLTFPVSQTYLNGNQSAHLMFEISSKAPSLLVTETAHGSSAVDSVTFTLETYSYYISGIIVLIGMFLANPWVDLDLAGFRSKRSKR